MMLGGIVFIVIDAEANGNVLAFGGGTDDNFLGAALDMSARFISVGEKTRAFQHNRNTQIAPRNFSRVFFRKSFDLVAVYYHTIASAFILAPIPPLIAFLAAHL